MNPVELVQLPNGVAVLTAPLPHARSCAVAVFVRWGSAHESRALSGIGHVLEHMAFKGTATRDARRINLDAERLGAEVNAHTDKDHTAYHMRGLAGHAPELLAQLADIVRHATLPADELERERQVLLHEFTEDEDDPLSTAFKLFDRASFGLHPAAQPVISTRLMGRRTSGTGPRRIPADLRPSAPAPTRRPSVPRPAPPIRRSGWPRPDCRCPRLRGCSPGRP